MGQMNGNPRKQNASCLFHRGIQIYHVNIQEPVEQTWSYSLCQCEFVQIAVCVEWVDRSQVDELLEGFVDEDEADEGGEGLLCETSDVAHQRASIRGNQHQAQRGRPQADAGPQGQIGQMVVPELTTRD